MFSKQSLFLALGFALILPATACKSEEPPPPLPPPKPAEEKQVVDIMPLDQDSGAEEEEKPKRKRNGTKKATGMAACCAALRQNATNAPPDLKAHLQTAAAACNAASASGNASFLSAIGGILQGAGIPSACK